MLRSAEEPRGFEPPYPPGWLDRLSDWIDRMPGPNSAYYLGLGAVQLAYVTGVLWLNGKLPVGSVDLPRTFMVIVAPYFLWLRSYLDRVGGAAMDAFRPALAVSDAEFLALRYQLTTLPARTTRIVTAVAIAVSLANVSLLQDSTIEQYASSRGSALLQLGPIVVLVVAVTAVSVFQAIHQLRMVERIYGLVGKISLFRSKPLYAFSGLTARTGVGFLLAMYYVAAIRPDLAFGSPALRALLIAMVPIAIASFVLPLRGIHLRIAAEKSRALAEATSRFEALIVRLHERVDKEILVDADKLNMQITSLVAEREALSRLSTWPWDAATVTGFVSALVVPALLWVITRVLGRMGL
jgi:hypothetical protein